jgi:hypothetical protein
MFDRTCLIVHSSAGVDAKIALSSSPAYSAAIRTITVIIVMAITGRNYVCYSNTSKKGQKGDHGME